jgi:prolyl-tRNA editing enzyme YbaK/EbsC (Cys-tRNA(Pro) deacylase)
VAYREVGRCRVEARGVAHRGRVYDPERAFHSADEAADLLRVPGASLLKTLVVLRDAPGRAKPLLVLVPCDRQVDLKRLAQRPRREATPHGQPAGGRAAHRASRSVGSQPLAVRSGVFEVLVDASAAAWSASMSTRASGASTSSWR